MSDILINQSVAILCDGNNIERSIHEMSKSTKAMIDFDQLIPKFEAEGMKPFDHAKKGKGMPYWSAPAHVIEDKQLMKLWAEDSYEAAVLAKKK